MTSADVIRKNVYFAGAIFDHKALVGNFLLAQSIHLRSQGLFHCTLPQDVEVATGRAIQIRDRDIMHVLSSDIALFNFDGTELDSGTVVEFMIAKFLDIPAVVVRTDFRGSGDQGPTGEPWNLMCSGYPRVRTVIINGMAQYHEAKHEVSSPELLLAALYEKFADEIVGSLKSVLAEPSILEQDEARMRAIYDWTIDSLGVTFKALFDQECSIEDLIQRRLAFNA